MEKAVGKAFLAVVSGRVQGVGFRYSARAEADKYGLAGWVRNCENGDVELWAEGREDGLQGFLRWLHKGPDWADVENVHIQWQKPREIYKHFSIR